MIITLPNKHTRDSFLNCSADPAVHTEWSCCWHEILSFQITLPFLVLYILIKIVPGSAANISIFPFSLALPLNIVTWKIKLRHEFGADTFFLEQPQIGMHSLATQILSISTYDMFLFVVELDLCAGWKNLASVKEHIIYYSLNNIVTIAERALTLYEVLCYLVIV